MNAPDGFSSERAGGIWLIVAPLLKEEVEGQLDAFEDLVRAAREAKSRAYAPYSRFQVGSAVVMDGTIFTGANVENASYGATLCAERNAISAAVAAGHRRLEIVAVSTSAPSGTAIDQRSPCGICRQVISEFAGPGSLVLLDAGDTEDGRIQGEVIAFESLLPWRFRLG
jgi:cytidine deaminase